MTTYSALYYHLIWSTKNRDPSIHEAQQGNLHSYMAGIIRGKKATPILIGGMPDHIHILLQSKPDTSISTLVKDIKVNSTLWLKQTSRLPHFSWQEGYAAFSVSKSNVDDVKQYVANQKDHHRVRTFSDELVSFLDKHEVEYDLDYVLR